jgi:Tol biopolymer transport system component
MPFPAYATYPGGNGLIAYGTNRGVRAIQPDGANDHSLMSSERFVTDVAFSPDGSSVVVAEETLHGDRIVMVNLYTAVRRIVLASRNAPTQTIYSVAMSPNGDSIVFCSGFSGHLYTVGADGFGLSKIANGYCYADWGIDGRIVAQKGIFPGDGDRLVTVMNPDGSNRVVVARFPDAKASWDTVYILVPSWAPDGSSVVFTAQRHRIQPDLWAVDSDGSHLRRLTDTRVKSESGPMYSPDGTRIVFSVLGSRSSSKDLWLMNADGSQPTRLTNTATRDEYSFAWQST